MTEFLISISVTGLLLGLSGVMIFRNKFSKKTQEKYLSYYKLKDPFIAWVFFLPMGIVFFIYTVSLLIN